MKKLVLSALVAVGAVSAPAFASESEDFCIAFAEEHDLGTEPCACIGEAAEADASVKEELLAMTSPDEAENWSDNTKDALGACFPQG